MLLTWENVTLGAPAVLEGVNLVLRRGLWGVAGLGKTTLLRCGAALTRPHRGRLLFDGDDIWDDPVAYRWRVGYVPQDAEELPPVGAVQYLEYLGALKGIRPQYQRSRASQMLAYFALPDRSLATYSAGMKRRIAVATALLNDPDILLLDDPITGLDPEERINLLNCLTQLADERIILLATSLPEEADGAVQGWVMLRSKGAHLHADSYRSSFQDVSRPGHSSGRC